MFTFFEGLTLGEMETLQSWLNGVLVIGNVAVWGGVFMEAERFPKRVQAWGWRILILGLSVETVIAAFLWQLDTKISGKQNAAIVAMGGTIDNFETYVAKKIATGDQQFSKLKLETDAQISKAKRAAGALDAARAKLNSELETVTTSLKEAKALHDSAIALARPRTLTDAQIEDIANAIRPFAKTQFTLAVNQETEPTEFITYIARALERGGWTWKEPPSIANGGLTFNIEGKPRVPIMNFRGFAIQIAESRLEKLKAPLEALAAALYKNGVTVTALRATADTALSNDFDKDAIKIIVGVKP